MAERAGISHGVKPTTTKINEAQIKIDRYSLLNDIHIKYFSPFVPGNTVDSGAC